MSLLRRLLRHPQTWTCGKCLLIHVHLKICFLNLVKIALTFGLSSSEKLLEFRVFLNTQAKYQKQNEKNVVRVRVIRVRFIGVRVTVVRVNDVRVNEVRVNGLESLKSMLPQLP